MARKSSTFCVATHGSCLLGFPVTSVFCDGLKGVLMITLNDAKLLNYFKEVDQLPDAEQLVILKVITAYLRDFRTQQAYA